MFKGLGAIGGLGNMASMIGAAQQLPEKLKELNETMKNETVVADSDCGRVTMTVSCTGVVQNVKIRADSDPNDLESAVASASNNAGVLAKQKFAAAAAAMARDMNLDFPGMDDMIENLAGGR